MVNNSKRKKFASKKQVTKIIKMYDKDISKPKKQNLQKGMNKKPSTPLRRIIL
mgnify:CR=1 FL=1